MRGNMGKTAATRRYSGKGAGDRSQPANRMRPMATLSLQSRIDELARQEGFATAGIAAVPAPGSPEDQAERDRFARLGRYRPRRRNGVSEAPG